jgi:hypothetical protein
MVATGKSPYSASIRVDQWKVRQIFNEGQFTERAESGELEVQVKRSKEVLTNKFKGWVPGTLSQELRYYDSSGLLVAKAHRYLRPDGKLAASGMVDPKRVVKDDVMYIVELPEEGD